MFSGAWCVVTGASSGIGRALAVRLGRAGARVVLCARREEALREAAAQVREAGGEALVEPLDVGETERAVARLRALDEALGGVTLVVANAGVGAASAGREPYAWETLGPALHTNFTGAAATLTALLPAMVRRGRGHLLGVSSLAAYGALPASAAYCAPKAGLSMLLDCLRVDTAGTGVTVTEARVGFVRTPMVAASTHPMPGLLEPDEAAERLYAALCEGRDFVAFPAPLALGARLAGALPRAAHTALARALRRVR